MSFKSFAKTIEAPADAPRMVQTDVCPEGEVWEFAVFAAFHNKQEPREIRLEYVQEENETNAKNVVFDNTRMHGDGQGFGCGQSLCARNVMVYPGYRLRANFPLIPAGTQITIEYVRRVITEGDGVAGGA